jgi:C-terminal peptidase prc
MFFWVLLFTSGAQAGVSERAYERAVDLIERMYLYPDKVTAPKLLAAAAQHLADEVSWLLVEVEGEAVYLRHGLGKPIGSLSVAQMNTLPEALLSLERLLLESGYDLEDLDVRVEILKGAMQALDRYSKVLAGEQLNRFNVRLKGTMVGIGATLALTKGHLKVTKLLKNAPAQRGGLEVGDRVVRINGVSTLNLPLREATRRIRGEAGTEVDLTIIREGTERDLTLTRAKVVVPNVSHRVLDGGIGYVKIDHFSQKTHFNLKNALAVLREQQGMSRGLVLDLRGNTGGSMKEAGRVADLFVPSGLLLRTAGADGKTVQNLQARMDAVEDETDVDLPLVVLVDDRTASGSEILAGALVQLERAALVGSKTYGKGTVQKIYTLGEGARFKLTVAQYILAGDLFISKGGLLPDLAVADIDLSSSGVRYKGWRESKAGRPWDEIVPAITERRGWRDQIHEPGDLRLELARRALLQVTGAKRATILQALEEQGRAISLAQDAHLVDALAAHQIDWSAPPEGEEVAGGEADALVEVKVHRSAPDSDTYIVAVNVENLSPNAMYQTFVKLDCPTFSAWNDLILPLGKLEPGAEKGSTMTVTLVPGFHSREDEVYAQVQSANYGPLPRHSNRVASESSKIPAVFVTARLMGVQKDRKVEVVVRNLGEEELEGVEVYFSHPGDLNLELLDQAARVPVLVPGQEERLQLGIRIGEALPVSLPLHLVVEADGYRQELAEWPVQLPLNGETVHLQAPTFQLDTVATSHPVGTYLLPVDVQDETGIQYVVVYVNGRKQIWLPGSGKALSAEVPVQLRGGRNAVVMFAVDSDGLETRQSLRIWGDDLASVDAEEPKK